MANKSANVNTPAYKDFTGGLNVRDAAHAIKDNEATQAQNVFFNQEGGVNKRGGWTKLAANLIPSTNNIIGLCHAAWVESSAIVRKVIATDGTTICRLDGANWTDITGALTRVMGASDLVSFITMNNIVIGYDGKVAPFKITSSSTNAALLAGSPPVGNIAIVWQNRLWWAGVRSAQTRLYYSEIGDPETYSASFYIDIPSPFDGDPITGLAILYGNLVIFKRYSIYILQGSTPDTFVLSKTNSTVGCVSEYSPLAVNNLIYFVSDKGLYAMNLTNNRQVCYKVEPRYNLGVRNQLLNGTLYRNRIQSIHYRKKNQIWVAIDATASGQDQHDRVMVHDYAITDEAGDPAASEYVVRTGTIGTIAIAQGGLGYQLGDVLTVFGGDNNCTLSVTGIGGTGNVTSVSITAGGSGYIVSNNVSVNGPHGAGCAINILTLTGFNGSAPSVWADYTDNTGDIVPIASFYDKYVYVYNDASTADTDSTGVARAIVAKWYSKYFDFGDGFAYKTFRFLRTNILYTGGIPKFILVKSNDIGVSSTTITTTPASASTFYNQRTVVGASAQNPAVIFWMFGFQSDDGGSFVLYQIGFDLVWKGRRN